MHRTKMPWQWQRILERWRSVVAALAGAARERIMNLQFEDHYGEGRPAVHATVLISPPAVGRPS